MAFGFLSEHYERPELLEKSLKHYRKRLADLPEDEDIEPIMTDSAKSTLEKRTTVIDAILKELDGKQYERIQYKKDFYYGTICNALNCYLKDLENFVKQAISKLGYNTDPFQEITLEMEKIKEIIPVFCLKQP